MSKINVTRSSMPPYEEYIEEIKDLWDSRWLTHSGVKHLELEKRLKEYLKIQNITLFANGHLALEAALNIFNLSGEVITTPFTYGSTTQAIVRAGLTPVFCDIEPYFYTIDVDKIEDLITEKTVAIVPIHVYGNVCDCKKIEKLASKYNLKVIYDAAHAFGVKADGISVGNFGDASMFSFHATKVFHTIEGGALIYRDALLKKHFDAWKMYGMYDKEDAEIVGLNAKLTEFAAAMGLCNLRHIDEEIEKRKRCVETYREYLSDVPGIKICEEQENVISNYAYFPVYFNKKEFGENREEVLEKLSKEDIYPRRYFYPLTSEFTLYQGKFFIQETPVAKDASRNILTLPLYADLSVDNVKRVCEIILRR